MSNAVNLPATTTLVAARKSRRPHACQGGNLYIERPADGELLHALQAGECAYVLAARQTGKSRLLRHTQARLTSHGYRCVKLDMGALAFENTVPQWYLSMACEIAAGLGQPHDFAKTVFARSKRQPPSQRFVRFLQEVLSLSDAPLVLFLDEVEAFLTMPKAVAVEFLAALRFFVDARAPTLLYRPLSFCMMGACTPTELMRGGQHNLFNAAREITLADFDWDSVRASFLTLFAERGPQAEAALARVYYWTQGHPYITQRLCAQLRDSSSHAITTRKVDRLVREICLGPMVREQEDFREIERRLYAGPPFRALRRLALYQRLLRGDKVPARRRNPLHLELRLSGLVKLVPGEPPFLAIRNPIFSSVFDASWLLQNRQFGLIRPFGATSRPSPAPTPAE